MCQFIVRAQKGRTEGYGCQIDTHVFYNHYTEEMFAEWLRRIDAMRLQSVRTQVFPEWYEWKQGCRNFDTEEMRSLYRLLDLCEARGIKVDLSFYGCCRIFRSRDGTRRGSWLANGFEGNWITAPRLKDACGNPFDGYGAYADSVCALLLYLLDVKQYTCIYEISIFPEPNCSFFDEAGDCKDEAFIAFYRVVAERIARAGLKDRILFSGPGDCANEPVRYRNYVSGLGNIVKKNTSSVYKFTESSANAEMYGYAAELVSICAAQGNTWGVCECGSHHFIDPANQSDIDTYTRALFLARFFINLTNAGCTNIKYWVLNDVWYGDYVMRLGLWKLMDECRGEARPQYYVWSLITKLTEFGSEIYPLEGDETVCGTAFCLPDGAWVYFFVNNGAVPVPVSVANHLIKDRIFSVYTVTEEVCTGTAEVISASGQIAAEDGELKATLSPKSFIALKG